MNSVLPDFKKYFQEMLIRLGVAEETKKEIDRLVAPDFNLFSILWSDEVRLSNMIASLLNPLGFHGQGGVFLDAFLNFLEDSTPSISATQKIRDIKSAWTNSKNIKSEIEQSTGMIEASQRRMDILVSGNKYGLMIENKPWATDQRDQLKDYHEELSKRFEQHISIYLSGDGTPPKEHSLSEKIREEHEQNGELLIIAYRPNLVEWLQRCVTIAEADRVRWILKDFIVFIENSFPTQCPSNSTISSSCKTGNPENQPAIDEFIKIATENELNMRVAILAGYSFAKIADMTYEGLQIKLKENIGKKDIRATAFFKHARINDENLHIAQLAKEAYTHLRIRIFNQFSAKLLEALQAKGWTEYIKDRVKLWAENGNNGYMISFQKTNWKNSNIDIHVGISPAEHFKFHELVVFVNDPMVQNVVSERLVNSFKKPSKSKANCIWRERLTTCLTGLDSPEGLMSLSEFDQKDMLLDLVNRIDDVGQVIDSALSDKNRVRQ